MVGEQFYQGLIIFGIIVGILGILFSSMALSAKNNKKINL